VTGPDAVTRAILKAHPELARHVHLVNGRPWCDGINHTTRCDPAFAAPSPRDNPGAPCLAPGHYWLTESDGMVVCQICGEVKRARATKGGAP